MFEFLLLLFRSRTLRLSGCEHDAHEEQALRLLAFSLRLCIRKSWVEILRAGVGVRADIWLIADTRKRAMLYLGDVLKWA